MLYFPQLSSGAVTQYPVSRHRRIGTIANHAVDGRTFKAPDHGASEIDWELRYNALTDSELSALEGLFEAAEGRLNCFTFLDPIANLLLWSDNLTASAWNNGPLLQIEGVEHLWGAMRVNTVSNVGAADQALTQSFTGPGWYDYCFSFFARGSGSPIYAYRSSGSSYQGEVVHPGLSWRRFAVSGRFDTVAESVTFGLRFPPGVTAEIAGLQVQPQRNASPYARSTSRCGVHYNARFADDVLRIISHHVNQHSAVVRISAAS